jgi:hypothetical protein
MIKLCPDTFELLYRAIAADPESDFRLREIDDSLQQATPHSEHARACTYIAVKILSSLDRPYSLAFALNTAVGASHFAGDVELAERYLKQAIDLNEKTGANLALLGGWGTPPKDFQMAS